MEDFALRLVGGQETAFLQHFTELSLSPEPLPREDRG